MNHAHTNSVATPCVMVIFGATGDLTKRKLIPALCNLAADTLLSKQFAIIGFAGNDFTTESFRKTLAEEIPKYSSTKIDPATWAWFAERIYYIKGDFTSPSLRVSSPPSRNNSGKPASPRKRAAAGPASSSKSPLATICNPLASSTKS